MNNIILFTLLFFSQATFACKCGFSSAEGVFDKAEEIFIGKLVEKKLDEKKEWYTYKFEIKKSWKSQGKNTITVSAFNSRCTRLIGDIGTNFLLKAFLHAEKLQLTCHSTNLDRKPYKRRKQISDKYHVTLQEELDYLYSLPSQKFEEIKSGIEVRVDNIEAIEIDSSSPFEDRQFTEISLNKGSTSGIYRGMDLCNETDDMFLTVYQVSESSALAIHETSPSEIIPESGDLFKSCVSQF